MATSRMDKEPDLMSFISPWAWKSYIKSSKCTMDTSLWKWHHWFKPIGVYFFYIMKSVELESLALTLKLDVKTNSSIMFLATPSCLSPPGNFTKSYWGSRAYGSQDRAGENQGQEYPFCSFSIRKTRSNSHLWLTYLGVSGQSRVIWVFLPLQEAGIIGDMIKILI